MAEVLSRGTLAEKVYDACSEDVQTKAAAARVTNEVLDQIAAHLASGGDVRLDKFGAFTVEHRDARTGRNPSDGSTIQIPAKNVVKFSAYGVLKDAVQSVNA